MMDAADYRADYRSFSNIWDGCRCGETQTPHSFLALMHVHEQLLKTSIDQRNRKKKQNHNHDSP